MNQCRRETASGPQLTEFEGASQLLHNLAYICIFSDLLTTSLS